MNNGQGSDNPLNRQLGLRATDTVTPEAHARNQNQIQMMRNYVDEMERQNQNGLQRWYSAQERELQEKVAAGRQAEYVKIYPSSLEHSTHFSVQTSALTATKSERVRRGTLIIVFNTKTSSKNSGPMLSGPQTYNQQGATGSNTPYYANYPAAASSMTQVSNAIVYSIST